MQTERTILRRFTLADYAELRRLECDAEVMRTTGLRRVQTPAETRERLARMVRNRAEQEPLGVWGAFSPAGELLVWVMLLEGRLPAPELGFMLPRHAWGRGLATEVAIRIADHALDALKLAQVVAVTDAENEASQRVLTKAGFVPYPELACPGRGFVRRREG